MEEEEEEEEVEEGDMEDMGVVEEQVSSHFSSFFLLAPSSWPVSGGTLIGNTPFAQLTLTQVCKL